MTTELIFVCLSLFNSIRTPLALLPLAIISVIKLIVSIKRLEDFLNAEELTAQEFKYPTQAQNCIEIKNGTFCWGRETQGGSGQWAVYYTIPQNFIKAFLFVGLTSLGIDCLIHQVSYPNVSTTNCNLQIG